MVGSTRARGRRQVAVVVGSVALLSSGLLLRANLAEAHATSSVQPMTCPLAGAISVDYGVEHVPMTIEAGKSGSLILTPTVTAPDNVKAIAVKSLVISMPVPAALNNVDFKAKADGNLNLTSSTVSGGVGTVTLAAAANVTVGTLDVPTLLVGFDVPAAAAGTSIAVAGPTTIAITVDLGTGPILETCTANAGNPLLVTLNVAAATGPTTATTAVPGTSTTTAAPGTSTTAGTGSTTTTRATSTTSGGGATTTTRATSTTSRPATTTTQPTSTTTSGAVAGVTTSTIAGAAGGGATPATPVAANPTFAG